MFSLLGGVYPNFLNCPLSTADLRRSHITLLGKVMRRGAKQSTHFSKGQYLTFSGKSLAKKAQTQWHSDSSWEANLQVATFITILGTGMSTANLPGQTPSLPPKSKPTSVSVPKVS